MSEGEPKLDARMVRTQQALRAALLALLARKSLDDVSIRDIVAEAGIGYATFFRHFPSKAALLEEVVEDEIARLIDLSLSSLQEAGTLASCLALFRHVDANRALWSALLTGGAAGTIREQFAKAAAERGPQRIDHRSDIPMELGVLFGVTSTVEIIAWWLRQGPGFPVERIAEIHDRLVVKPSITPGG
ncbi:MAG: helix-turn-helix transcriptional regulator [Sphingomonadales bacterium]|nr:helix-turn-helix transcriptional regulator [Sphingomonadales bacterium]